MPKLHLPLHLPYNEVLPVILASLHGCCLYAVHNSNSC